MSSYASGCSQKYINLDPRSGGGGVGEYGAAASYSGSVDIAPDD